MNEMNSVATNGSWVTTIMKIRAGSRGARRAQSAERRSAPLDGVPGASGAPPRGRSSVVLIAPPSRLSSRGSTDRGSRDGRLVNHGSPPSGRSLWFSLAVALGHVVGQLLPAFERVVDRGLAGDRRADLLGHLGPQVGELGDADELDPRRRTGLHAGIVGVGGEDRLERGLRER